MQHALDLARPYAPLILALVVWPIVGAALSWWLWWDTPEHWEAYAKAHPGRALAIRALRTVSPHLRKLVVAWRDYAAARSSLPPLGIALPAEKTGALVVSETRPVAHPTPADGVAFDAQRVALGAVTVDPAKGDGQRGSVDLPGLLTCLIAAILAGALLAGCPRNPPVSGCQPEDLPPVCSASQRWHVPARGADLHRAGGRCGRSGPPTTRLHGGHVCSASQRWHVAGDRTCSSIGGQCTVLGGRAYCAPVADAGSPDASEGGL
jgi:hypothetical protein